jgi:hypothetical protein
MTERDIVERVSDALLAAYTKAEIRGSDEIDALELQNQAEQYFFQELKIGGSDEYSAALAGLPELLAPVRNANVSDGVLDSLKKVTDAVAQEAGTQMAREIVGLFLVHRIASLTESTPAEVVQSLST